MNPQDLLSNTPPPPLIYLAMLAWSLFWKGLALWKASKYDQKVWFVALFALMLINTLGIVDIIYLFGFAKTKMKISELKFWGTKK